MDFQPQTEKEIRSAFVLEKGEYNFEVSQAERKQSKSGNEMIELSLTVCPSGDGPPRNIRDWLLGTPTMMYKLRRFCYATGL